MASDFVKSPLSEQAAKVESYATWSDQPKALRSEWGAHDWGWCDGVAWANAEHAAQLAAIREAVAEVRTAMNAHYGGYVTSQRLERLEALLAAALDGARHGEAGVAP